MASAKKLTRHELKDPDQILTAADHAIRWATEHPKEIKIAVVAAVAVGVLGLGINSWLKARDTRANEALTALLDTSRRPAGTAAAASNEDLEPFANQAAKNARDNSSRCTDQRCAIGIVLWGDEPSGPTMAASRPAMPHHAGHPLHVQCESVPIRGGADVSQVLFPAMPPLQLG